MMLIFTLDLHHVFACCLAYKPVFYTATDKVTSSLLIHKHRVAQSDTDKVFLI